MITPRKSKRSKPIVFESEDYPVGTIGHAMAFGDKAGRAAWLAGVPLEQNPFVTYEHTLERAGWALGWLRAETHYLESMEDDDEA